MTPHMYQLDSQQKSKSSCAAGKTQKIENLLTYGSEHNTLSDNSNQKYNQFLKINAILEAQKS